MAETAKNDKALKNNRLLNPEKAERRKLFITYTLSFAIMYAIIYAYCFCNGYFLMQTGDSFTQHSKALGYYAAFLRSIVKNLLFEHKLVIPQFDFSVGLGSDVISTFSYYVIGDPANILSVFCPQKYIVYYYQLMIIVRMWAAGISFSYMCFEFDIKNKKAILAGALSFALSSFATFNSVRHPYFINPLIYFPLIIVAIERILKGKSPLMMAAIVALAALSNFYWFYIIVVLTVVYVLIRLICLYYKNILMAFAPLVKIGFSSLLGVMMGAVLFLPVVLAFFSDTRSESHIAVNPFYGSSYYTTLPAALFSGAYAGSALQIGTSVLVIPSLALLFSSKLRTRKTLKILVAVLTAFMIFPIFGSILNGFAYVTNRWSFIFTLLVAFILSTTWEEIINIKNKKLAVVTAVTVIITVICLVLEKSRLISIIMPLAMLYALIIVLALRNAGKLKVSKKALENICVLICMAGLVSNGIYQLMPWGHNYVGSFATSDYYYSYAYYSDIAMKSELKNNPDDSFFRYSGRNIRYNSTINSRLQNTQFYWSLSNGNISATRTDLNMRENYPYKYEGFDDRTALNALASVKYYHTNSKVNTSVPYGFVATDTKDLYVNTNYLPLGYTYDSYITEEEYYGLSSSLDKQNAMIQSVVLECDTDSAEKGSPVYDSYKIDYDIKCVGDYITFEDNTFTTTRQNTKAIFFFKPVKNAEVYLCIDGMDYTGINPYDLYNDDTSIDPNNLFNQETWDELSDEQKEDMEYFSKYYSEPTAAKLRIVATDRYKKTFEKKLEYFTPEYYFYSDRTDFDVNLGYTKGGYYKVAVTFPHIGKYSFEDISLQVQPMKNYNSYIDKLQENVLVNGKFKDNVLTGEITLPESKILCLSVPYSKGWTAYVNGQETELLKANGMYCAVELDAGDNSIELRYETPGFKQGIIISIIGLVIFIFGVYYYFAYDKKKKLRNKA